MNELSKRQTALEMLGIQESQTKQIKNTAIISNIEARKGFPVRSLTSSELSKFLRKQIELIMANLGQQNSGEGILEAIVEQMPSILNQSYFNWTREEMAEAFKFGSIGHLGGKEIHISSRTLISWLDQYNDQHRKPAYRKLKTLSAPSDSYTPKPKEMSVEERKTALNDAFKQFLKGDLNGYSHYFSLLWSEKRLNIDESKTWELVGRATAEILMEAKEAKSPILKQAIKNRKEEIKGILKPDKSTIPEFVTARMKQIAVEDYFKSLPEDYVF